MKAPEKVDELLYRAEVAKRLHIYDIFANHEVAYSFIQELQPSAQITQRSHSILTRLALYEIGKDPKNPEHDSEANEVLEKLVEYDIIQKGRNFSDDYIRYSLTSYGIENFGDFMVFLRLFADLVDKYENQDEYKNGVKAYKEAFGDEGLVSAYEKLYLEGEVELLKKICKEGLAYPLLEILATELKEELENIA